MIVLPEGMFSMVTNPEESSFGLCTGQTREVMLTITPSAGWYNHYGKVLGQGDLALGDFVNILTALAELEEELGMEAGPFVVAPLQGDKDTHRTLSPHELIERCTFIITAEMVYVLDLLTAPLEHIFVKNNIPFVLAHRTDAHALFGLLLLH
jgi:hypothetical protein